MSLTDEYKRQLAWRDWDIVLDALPSLAGATILDLGCGVGDVAELLSRRGAHVVGVDMNEELLTAALSRTLPRAEFRCADLRNLPSPEDLAGAADAENSAGVVSFCVRGTLRLLIRDIHELAST